MSKILITNNSLEHYTGSESWVYAMAKELSKDHEVEVFALHHGLMSKEIRCRSSHSNSLFSL